MQRIGLWSYLAFIGVTLLMFSGSEALAAERTSGKPTNIQSKDNKSFSFVVWGHPRGLATGEPPLHFEEILKCVSDLKADLLIITGDIIEGMWGKVPDPNAIRADWDRFDAGVKRLGIPIYRLPGNHDLHNNITRDIYLERYAKVPFAFTYKGSRFILSDTIGIEQKHSNDQVTWKGGIQPFDEKQLGFIRNEITQQNNYNHVFIFMHNPQPWSESSGFWWKDVHPMLVGGKTRAVFAGSPWYFKYAHLKQDGIHYILSSTLHTPAVEHLRRIPNPAQWAMYKQLDNLQYIKVEGDQFTIQTIAIGALETESLNWRFWDKVEKRPSIWARNFMVRFHMKFNSLRGLIFLAGAWGGIWLVVGLFLAAWWMRRRYHKAPLQKNNHLE